MHKYLVAFAIRRSGQPDFLTNKILARETPIVISSGKDKKKLEKELCRSHFRGLKKYFGDNAVLLSCQRLPIQ
jgi:hypothetical protein